MFSKVAFGDYKPVKNYKLNFRDLNKVELSIFVLLSLASLFLGIAPNVFLDYIECSTYFIFEYKKFA